HLEGVLSRDSEEVREREAGRHGPAALMPNPCPTGSWCVSRTLTSPARSATRRRATSSEMVNDPATPLVRRSLLGPSGSHVASAVTPSASTTPAPRDPRARGSRAIRSGANTPVMWPGANAAARRTRSEEIARFTDGAKMDYL